MQCLLSVKKNAAFQWQVVFAFCACVLQTGCNDKKRGYISIFNNEYYTLLFRAMNGNHLITLTSMVSICMSGAENENVMQMQREQQILTSEWCLLLHKIRIEKGNRSLIWPIKLKVLTKPEICIPLMKFKVQRHGWKEFWEKFDCLNPKVRPNFCCGFAGDEGCYFSCNQNRQNNVPFCDYPREAVFVLLKGRTTLSFKSVQAPWFSGNVIFKYTILRMNLTQKSWLVRQEEEISYQYERRSSLKPERAIIVPRAHCGPDTLFLLQTFSPFLPCSRFRKQNFSSPIILRIMRVQCTSEQKHKHLAR